MTDVSLDKPERCPLVGFDTLPGREAIASLQFGDFTLRDTGVYSCATDKQKDEKATAKEMVITIHLRVR